MRNIKTKSVIAASLLALCSLSAQAEIVVIVNAKNPAASLSAEPLSAPGG